MRENVTEIQSCIGIMKDAFQQLSKVLRKKLLETKCRTLSYINPQYIKIYSRIFYYMLPSLYLKPNSTLIQFDWFKGIKPPCTRFRSHPHC